MARLDVTGGLCRVCARVEVGIGVRHAGNIRWICSDPECLDIITRCANVSDQTFTRIEAEAAIQGGGGAMGAFLDEAGYGHLFEGMPPEVWAEASKAFGVGYRKELKILADKFAAPF